MKKFKHNFKRDNYIHFCKNCGCMIEPQNYFKKDKICKWCYESKIIRG